MQTHHIEGADFAVSYEHGKFAAMAVIHGTSRGQAVGSVRLVRSSLRRVSSSINRLARQTRELATTAALYGLPIGTGAIEIHAPGDTPNAEMIE
ncbi:MAG: hypothetical protein KDD44_09285, partial [Bdellovibrionales bacterium]|nr:hypothetical protein [Bdellovibrionales bacterium]